MFNKRIRQLIAALLITIFGFVASSVGLTIMFRFVPPPLSALMIEREIDSWTEGKTIRFTLRMGRFQPDCAAYGIRSHRVGRSRIFSIIVVSTGMPSSARSTTTKLERRCEAQAR